MDTEGREGGAGRDDQRKGDMREGGRREGTKERMRQG